MTATATDGITVPADLLNSLTTALRLARTDLGEGLRDWGHKDCFDCGPDDTPCEAHQDDQRLIDDIDALLGLLPQLATQSLVSGRRSPLLQMVENELPTLNRVVVFAGFTLRVWVFVGLLSGNHSYP